MVHALHSSSMVEEDNILYGGEAAGLLFGLTMVLQFILPDDTGVFGDMQHYSGSL